MADEYYLSGENVLAVDKAYQLPEGSFRFAKSSNRRDHRHNIYIFDFEFRTVTTLMRGGAGSKEHTQIVPFSQMDDAVIAAMREKLVALGSKLPEDPTTIRKGLTAQNTGGQKLQPKGAQ
jgi:hypothetical protein